jgi:hypothetical protein
MIYPGEGKEGQPKAGDYVLAAERVRAEAAANPHRSSTAVDLARADKWEGQARTKQLPSTRTEIGAGGELVDIENRWDNALDAVNTVADPDYVTASASRERLELAGEAGSLDLALDAADTIQGQDSLDCKLHGGKSTGPRTPEGLERSRRANWKHGYYSRQAKAERSRVRAAILALRDLCDSI